MNEDTTTLFIRNWHPNRLVLTYAGQRYILERRGTREDNLALPDEARKDKTVARWLSNGTLEEITQDQFMELAVRSLGEVTAEQGKTADLKSPARDVNIPINRPDSTTPTVIADDLFDKAAGKKHMTPELTYREEPLTTEEELKEVQKPTKPARARRKTAT